MNRKEEDETERTGEADYGGQASPSCPGADEGSRAGKDVTLSGRDDLVPPPLSLPRRRLVHTLLGAYLASAEGVEEIPSHLWLKGQAPPTYIFREVVGRVA